MSSKKNKLEEKKIERAGKQVIQCRSQQGKLLIEKTAEGYELKCPRSKEVYLIPYEQMIVEYLTMWDDHM